MRVDKESKHNLNSTHFVDNIWMMA
jgi:hypothetical protein